VEEKEEEEKKEKEEERRKWKVTATGGEKRMERETAVQSRRKSKGMSTEREEAIPGGGKGGDRFDTKDTRFSGNEVTVQRREGKETRIGLSSARFPRRSKLAKSTYIYINPSYSKLYQIATKQRQQHQNNNNNNERENHDIEKGKL